MPLSPRFRPPRTRLVVCALCLAAAVGGAQGYVGLPGPGSGWPAPESVRVSREEMLLLDPYSGGFRSRYWYFNGLLDGGTALTVSLFEWRRGLLGAPGLLVTVAEPGRPPLLLETKIDEKDFEASTEELRVRFGDSELAADAGGMRVRLRLPEFSCDLSMESLLGPWKPGEGLVELDPNGEAYTRHVVIAPLAELSGRMDLSGWPASVHGWCYSDRGLVNLPLQRLNSEEFSFRVFGRGITPREEPWMISALEAVSAEAYGSRRVAQLLVGRGPQWLMATDAHSFQAKDYTLEEGAAVPYPQRLAVRAAGGGQVLEGEFVVTRLIALNDILARLPPVARQVAELFIKRPLIHRLGGYFLGTLDRPDGSREILYLQGQGEYSVFR